MKNQKYLSGSKGLSAVVVTLILVLLSIVAVGVVWVVVNNLIQSSSGQINTGSKCLQIGVSATSVVAGATAGTYDVTLKRTAAGGSIGGVNMTIFNSTGNSPVTEFGDVLTPLETKTKTITFDANTGSANKIEVTPYLASADGSALCSTTTFEF